MWFNANSRKNASLTINNSKIDVKVGDIFYTEGLKVIAFNEYFDSIVDNDIISEGSLNGIYINTKVDDLAEFDKTLDDNASLNRKVCDTNNDREKGKNKKYKLGTIYKKDDFLLTAFSKFDNDNRAYLNIDDYIEFLLNFWNEVDIIYSGRSVVIPLLGSGITRFKGYDAISEQELLELLIWSFKVSRMKFTYPSTVTILIHESKVDKINFYALQGD
nr:macro domain-containing protein [Vibrio crassostreae]